MPNSKYTTIIIPDDLAPLLDRCDLTERKRFEVTLEEGKQTRTGRLWCASPVRNICFGDMENVKAVQLRCFEDAIVARIDVSGEEFLWPEQLLFPNFVLFADIYTDIIPFDSTKPSRISVSYDRVWPVWKDYPSILHDEKGQMRENLSFYDRNFNVLVREGTMCSTAGWSEKMLKLNLGRLPGEPLQFPQFGPKQEMRPWPCPLGQRFVSDPLLPSQKYQHLVGKTLAEAKQLEPRLHFVLFVNDQRFPVHAINDPNLVFLSCRVPGPLYEYEQGISEAEHAQRQASYCEKMVREAGEKNVFIEAVLN